MSTTTDRDGDLDGGISDEDQERIQDALEKRDEHESIAYYLSEEWHTTSDRIPRGTRQVPGDACKLIRCMRAFECSTDEIQDALTDDGVDVTVSTIGDHGTGQCSHTHDVPPFIMCGGWSRGEGAVWIDEEKTRIRRQEWREEQEGDR